MKQTLGGIKNKLGELRKWEGHYRRLQKHLDRMPVGFPATFSGVERRLLKAMFSVDDARAAIYLDYHFAPLDTIYKKAAAEGWTREDLAARLTAMEQNGAIFRKDVDGVAHYALVPFAIGMYEMQVSRMTPGYCLDAREYVAKKYGIEYLTTAVPQMRVIPVEKSITPAHKVATYDEIRDIIEKTEKRIMVAECICRKARDLLGDPCRRTDRREICLGFRDFHDIYARHGWGRPISQEEAFAILEQSEKDGLVLQPSNEQEPQFVCSCCACCCGVLEMMKIMPRPADFAAGNFYAEVDQALCNGCGKCVKRCQMDAIAIEDKKARLDPGKCIGCGLCVTDCPTGAVALVKKEKETVPPGTTEALYETIMQNKKSVFGKYWTAVKGALGMKV